MSAQQSRTLGLYLATIVLAALVASGAVLQGQLASGQPLDWSPVLAALLGSILTGVTTSLLPSLRGMAGQPASPAPPLPMPRPDHLSETWPALHRQCGRIAFFAIAPPVAGADLESWQVRHTDGRPIGADDPILCDACGDRLAHVLAEGGQWITVSAPATLGGS